MSYKTTETSIPDLLILEPKVYDDERGYFFESFNQKDFNDAVNRDVKFVQDNHSYSKNRVLRGLHMQTRRPQGKLVRVAVGCVFDVAVDLRSKSSTFGRWVGIELSEINRRQLWIPEGFAHGFYVQSEYAHFIYKTTDYYDSGSEMTISWDDPTLNIKWPNSAEPIISHKDLEGCSFSEAKVKIK